MANSRRVRRLSDDNRIVHGLWIGPRLSKLEQLTVRSFLRNGHEFHLWLYEDLDTPLPKGVVIEDASEILPRERIFLRGDADPQAGVGKGSVAAFADLFRYKLLHERGGWWVDMDVTCLRPFDFKSKYFFRAHRLGVVNNIVKCPPRSELMRRAYRELDERIGRETPWSLASRVLSRHVAELKLSRHARSGLWNAEDWVHGVFPLVEKDELPSDWAAIHWMNEVWRTLEADGGLYKGRKLVETRPDKETPPSGGALARLYREHGLLDAPPAPRSEPGSTEKAPLVAPTSASLPGPSFADEAHINILVPTLALGGAERVVVETLRGLGGRAPTAKLFVLEDSAREYDLSGLGRARVIRLHGRPPAARLRETALEVLASPSQILFTHLVSAGRLRELWAYGVSTVPVIHSSEPGWRDRPQAYDSPNVPFVVAVSEDVAAQLKAAGCPKPVVVVRHELQRWFSVEELRAARQLVRLRHGIPDGTLLIGMVGEFKSQKAYTRAVRVLAAVRRHHPAKLMILGGWDHSWGHGRAAYAAACRQALELGVMPDLLTPGAVNEPEPYYAAFDVFLNTSVFEGLSIATLEAIRAGCPVVSADAGGNREGLPPEAVLVNDASDAEAFVDGIEKALSRGRRPVPARPPDGDLVPRLWTLLARRPSVPAPASEAGPTLFLTDNLNLGGAARSLVNLLERLPKAVRPWLAVAGEANHEAFLDELHAARVPVLSLGASGAYIDHAETTLTMLDRLRPRNLVFWNADARLKLLLAKVLPPGGARLIDVSGGPWVFTDLDRRDDFQRRLAFDRRAYFGRLDAFVAKYAGGAPPAAELAHRKLTVIPNGVPVFEIEGPVATAPAGADPSLVIGTCSRILPDKRLDFLIDAMAELDRRLPGVSLVVVGAVPPRHEPYWRKVRDRARALRVRVHFAGQQADVASYLRSFKVFVMLEVKHGCPNASLEALALGVPVVANPTGGTDEQVRHGVNGFLVSDQDPKDLAHRLRQLLTNPGLRQRFGEAGRRVAREEFSMETMVQRYTALLTGDGEPTRTMAPLRVPRIDAKPGVLRCAS